MKKYKKTFVPWLPKKPINEAFPFEYVVEEAPSVLENYEYFMQFTEGEDLLYNLRMYLIKIFPFFKYLDENSPHFLNGKVSDESLFFDIKIEHFGYVTDPLKKDKKGRPVKTKVHVDDWYVRVHSFKSEYRFNLVTSLSQLEEILRDRDEIAFDNETTGLNPETDYITGCSLSFEPKVGYYVPIKHNNLFSEFNLGDDALKLIYDALLKASVVYLFNSRFDMRMMEYSKLKFDMSKINFIDVQLNVSYVDPDMKERSLKGSEKWIMGYHRIDLDDTLSSMGISSYDTSLIDPRNILFYAAQDAVSTLEIGHATMKYYHEFGLSAQIDQALLVPLMRMENRPIRVDLVKGEKMLNEITSKLKHLNGVMLEEVGEINLNSTKQKADLFRSFGLDTGVKTDTGAMSTASKAVSEMLDRLKDEGKSYPKWLENLNELSKYEKLNNTFFGPVLEHAKLSRGRVRFNYRHGNTTTGRLSSGEEE